MDKVIKLADEIEQYMFERGEYDYVGDDRIRWLSADDSRDETTKNVRNAIVTDARPLLEYLGSEMKTAFGEDETMAINLALKLAVVGVFGNDE